MKFKNKITTILKLLFEPSLLRALLFSRDNGYLVDNGWVNSFLKKEPVDINGNPIPWMTYPAINFITSRLKNSFSIFEYGSGNSTLFFSRKVKRIVAVEHNLQWFTKIKMQLPDNVELIFQVVDINDKYCNTIKNFSEKFNLIIIDAEDRINCIKNCLANLTDDGIIILDDSDRVEYEDAFSFLKAKYFKRIDFWGISAGYMHSKATTIFYKDNNCFDI